jgi:hypothetical protein
MSTFGRGTMTDSHFNALIDATRMKSVGVICSLYEYLVNGHRKCDAYKMHCVDMSLFGRSLKALKKIDDVGRSLSKYYV